MQLSIIIVNYNGVKYIEKCCELLLRNLPNCEHEIILVDNHSTDGSLEIIKTKYKDVINIIECEKNYGPAGGRNIGARGAKGEYLLFLDHDTFINENTIPVMMRLLEDKNVGIVGCKLLNEDGSHQPSAKRFPRFSREIFSAFLLNRIFKNSRFSYVINSDKTIDVEWVSGPCFLMKKETFLNVNGFDEDYFYGAEEADICYRAIKQGWRVVYTPEAEAVHVAFGSNMVVTSLIYSNPLKAKIQFFKKHYPGARITFLKFILLIQTVNEMLLWVLIYLIKPKDKKRAKIGIKERAVRLKDLIMGRV